MVGMCATVHITTLTTTTTMKDPRTMWTITRTQPMCTTITITILDMAMAMAMDTTTTDTETVGGVEIVDGFRGYFQAIIVHHTVALARVW